jgi:F0F1-type ATP synthase membrane subunit a
VREALRGYFIWALVSNSTPTDSVVVLESIIGAAVVAAASLSPEFKLAVAQVALVHISDEKQRRFLADRGWNV